MVRTTAHKPSFARVLLAFAIGLCLCATLAQAQASRTWVSGVGDDANPCSRTAPCKTFAGAISKTAAGGEINALDPGGYGAVTITKAITIDGGSTFASILASGTNGIVVNAAAGDAVTIRNLSINGNGTGLNGIRFIAGGALHVENVVISQFTQKGIDFQPGNNSRLFVRKSQIRGNNTATGGGIFIKPVAGFTVTASIKETWLDRNFFGLRVEDGSTVTVVHTGITGSNGIGVSSIGTLPAVTAVILESVTISSNGTNGIVSSGSGSTVTIANCTVNNDNTGLAASSGGAIVARGGNRVFANTPGGDGAPTSIMLPTF